MEIRRHHTAFCNEHFLEFFERQVARAIEHERMFTPDDSVLVAVSGGKASIPVKSYPDGAAMHFELTLVP